MNNEVKVEDLKVIHEDKDIIVVIKPSGVSSQSDLTLDKSMLDIVTEYLKKNIDEKNKKQNQKEPYVVLVHRLDKPVGGIMVFAKNHNSLKSLNKDMQEGKFDKKYIAVTCGDISSDEGLLEDYMKKSTKSQKAVIVHKNDQGAKLARLKYTKVDSKKSNADNSDEILSLVKVELYTGRFHQIRCQLANEGFPIWGDKKYNPEHVIKREYMLIALWATSLSITQPTSKKRMTFNSSFPDRYPFNLFD